MKLTEFICYKCGECCRHLKVIPELKNYHINGICKYLKGNYCSIYNIRPFVCNRFITFEKYKHFMSEEEFVSILIKYCNKLKSKSKQ